MSHPDIAIDSTAPENVAPAPSRPSRPVRGDRVGHADYAGRTDHAESVGPSARPARPAHPGLARAGAVARRVASSLFVQLIVAIVAGVVVGLVWPGVAADVKILGDAFITLIKMVIAPLVMLVVVTGIARMGDIKAVGRVGGKALLYFLGISTFAIVFGMLIGNLVQPGAGLHIDPSTLDASALRDKTGGAAASTSFSSFLLGALPSSVFDALARNDILQILVFSVFLGLAAVAVGPSKVRPVLDVMDSALTLIFTVMRWIMRVAPLGAFGAMAYIIGQYGIGTLGQYARLIAACYGAAACFAVILFVIARVVAGVPLASFLSYARSEFGTALGTASTEAVMPQIIEKLIDAGCPRGVAGLVVPTGYSFNLDGAAIYLSTSLLFLAQAFGVHLDLGQQLVAIGVLLLTSKGMAGVPGSAFLALSATATALGIFPVSGVALLLGADRIMDSMRVFVNLLGNCVATFVVSRWEGTLDRDRMLATFAADRARRNGGTVVVTDAGAGVRRGTTKERVAGPRTPGEPVAMPAAVVAATADVSPAAA